MCFCSSILESLAWGVFRRSNRVLIVSRLCQRLTTAYCADSGCSLAALYLGCSLACSRGQLTMSDGRTLNAGDHGLLVNIYVDQTHMGAQCHARHHSQLLMLRTQAAIYAYACIEIYCRYHTQLGKDYLTTCHCDYEIGRLAVLLYIM